MNNTTSFIAGIKYKLKYQHLVAMNLQNIDFLNLAKGRDKNSSLYPAWSEERLTIGSQTKSHAFGSRSMSRLTSLRSNSRTNAHAAGTPPYIQQVNGEDGKPEQSADCQTRARVRVLVLVSGRCAANKTTTTKRSGARRAPRSSGEAEPWPGPAALRA